MLFKITLSLIAVGVCLCENEESCYTRASRICRSEELPTDYPETVEELKRDCNIIHETGNCYVRIYEDCPGFEDHAHDIERFLTFIDEECHEESPIFQEISKNIKCVAPAATSLDKACNWDSFSEEETDKLISLLEPLWEQESYLCGFGVEKMACAATVISHRCGPQLKDVVTTILENIDSNYQECTPELLEALTEFKEYYEAAILKTEMSNNIISDED